MILQLMNPLPGMCKIDSLQKCCSTVMLSEEGETKIDTLCDSPSIACDSENYYFKLYLPQKINLKMRRM